MDAPKSDSPRKTIGWRCSLCPPGEALFSSCEEVEPVARCGKETAACEYYAHLRMAESAKSRCGPKLVEAFEEQSRDSKGPAARQTVAHARRTEIQLERRELAEWRLNVRDISGWGTLPCFQERANREGD